MDPVICSVLFGSALYYSVFSHSSTYLYLVNRPFIPGDTPNNITDEEFQSMGEMAEGYSGSDISVVVSGLHLQQGGERGTHRSV